MRERKLTELLLSLFSGDELRRFIRWNLPSYEAHMPGGFASPLATAEALVSALNGRGAVDPDLFRSLREERPRRATEIDQVAGLWSTPAPTPPPSTGAFRWDLFLAHASPDKPTADRLYEELRAAAPELSVFLDARSLELGEAWDVQIPKALRSARVITVLVSDRIEAAWYARSEIAEAIALTRDPQADQRLVPLFLDGRPGLDSPIPYGLRQLHGLVLPEVRLDGAARQLAALAKRLRDAHPNGSR
jgi:hypothetical protein